MRVGFARRSFGAFFWTPSTTPLAHLFPHPEVWQPGSLHTKGTPDAPLVLVTSSTNITNHQQQHQLPNGAGSETTARFVPLELRVINRFYVYASV